jgi:4-hydroxy-tetrahydrodipicolinate reductase
VTPVYTISPGQVGAVRITFRAYKDGDVRVENQWVWVLGEQAAPPDWPYGDGAWTIRIEGHPRLESRIEATTVHDAKQPDVLMTAVHTVNAIPAVVTAPPEFARISTCRCSVAGSLRVPEHRSRQAGPRGS